MDTQQVNATQPQVARGDVCSAATFPQALFQELIIQGQPVTAEAIEVIACRRTPGKRPAN